MFNNSVQGLNKEETSEEPRQDLDGRIFLISCQDSQESQEIEEEQQTESQSTRL